MIQDIAPHIFSNAYAPKRPEATSYALYFDGHMVLAGKDSSVLRFPRFAELNGIEESVYEKAIYLFAIDNDGRTTGIQAKRHRAFPDKRAETPCICRYHGVQPLQMVRQPSVL